MPTIFKIILKKQNKIIKVKEYWGEVSEEVEVVKVKSSLCRGIGKGGLANFPVWEGVVFHKHLQTFANECLNMQALKMWIFLIVSAENLAKSSLSSNVTLFWKP